MAVNITNRADAEALIREQIVSTIFQDAPKQSVFMGMARKLPNMTSKKTRIRVLDFLPTRLQALLQHKLPDTAAAARQTAEERALPRIGAQLLELHKTL